MDCPEPYILLTATFNSTTLHSSVHYWSGFALFLSQAGLYIGGSLPSAASSSWAGRLVTLDWGRVGLTTGRVVSAALGVVDQPFDVEVAGVSPEDDEGVWLAGASGDSDW